MNSKAYSSLEILLPPTKATVLQPFSDASIICTREEDVHLYKHKRTHEELPCIWGGKLCKMTEDWTPSDALHEIALHKWFATQYLQPHFLLAGSHDGPELALDLPTMLY